MPSKLRILRNPEQASPLRAIRSRLPPGPPCCGARSPGEICRRVIPDRRARPRERPRSPRRTCPRARAQYPARVSRTRLPRRRRRLQRCPRSSLSQTGNPNIDAHCAVRLPRSVRAQSLLLGDKGRFRWIRSEPGPWRCSWLRLRAGSPRSVPACPFGAGRFVSSLPRTTRDPAIGRSGHWAPCEDTWAVRPRRVAAQMPRQSNRVHHISHGRRSGSETAPGTPGENNSAIQ